MQTNWTSPQTPPGSGSHRGGGRRPRWPLIAGVIFLALVAATSAAAFMRGSTATSATGSATGTATGSPAPATATGHGTGTRSGSATASPTATASAPTTPAGLPSSWKLAFNSDFSGSALNTSVWGECYPWGPSGCTNYGNGGEKEWYLPAQDHVSGGVLHLVAQREATAGYTKKGAPKQYLCRSGMATLPGYKFQYGYLQVTARVPYAKGLWPAFWLAAANGQWPPEIDIMEHWGSDPNAKVYLHPLNGPREGGPFPAPGIDAGWHTFAISWTADRLSWFIDGRQVMTTAVGVPQQAMYFIANVAVYDDSPGGCSGSLDIKSVKIWQPA